MLAKYVIYDFHLSVISASYKTAKLSALLALDPSVSHCSLAATKVLVTGHGPEVSLF